MLVITRKPFESFQIGPDILIKFDGFDRKGEIRVGIVAPKDLRILRSELVPEEERVVFAPR